MPPDFAFVRNEAVGPAQRADAYTTFGVNLAETSPTAAAYSALIRARRGTSPEAVAAAVDAVGRAVDARDFGARGNHAVQYVSHPEWPWSRLRKETPSRYEAYVDLVPGAWTKIKIEVRGERARLYVHDNEQPTLIVNDVKSGASAKGAVALWLGPGTVAHFRNLTVKPDPDKH
jgi:hypothetical protein